MCKNFIEVSANIILGGVIILCLNTDQIPFSHKLKRTWHFKCWLEVPWSLQEVGNPKNRQGELLAINYDKVLCLYKQILWFIFRSKISCHEFPSGNLQVNTRFEDSWFQLFNSGILNYSFRFLILHKTFGFIINVFTMMLFKRKI